MDDLNLSRYLSVLWKWSWLILLATLIGGGISYRVSQSIPRIYRSSVTLLVGDVASNPGLTPQELATSERTAITYSQLIVREPVLDATVHALHLPTDWQTLRGRILVTHADNSQLIEIRVLDSDPRRAQAIADELSKQLILQSPTGEGLAQVKQSREFVHQQLENLQTDIQEGEASLAKLKADLQKADSARSVLDSQDKIQALELKLTDWRSTYATLLNAYQGNPSNTVSVVEPPSLENAPVSPNVRSNVLMAAALGMSLAVGAICLIEYLDDAIGTPDDVTRSLAMRILGLVVNVGRMKRGADALVTARDPFSTASEAFRLLRASITTAYADEEMTPVVVTSPGTHAGKSFISANLAVSYAQSGKSVILVDADVRHPTIHTYFARTNEVGLTSVLADADLNPSKGESTSEPRFPGDNLERQLEQLLAATDILGLRILPSGPMRGNPGELLGSPRMGQLLRVLQGMADVVILDSPPVLPVADTMLLAGKWVAVILVLEAGKTPTTTVRLTNETLRQNRAHVLGVVLNKVPRSALPYHYYPYHRPAVGETGRRFPLRVIHRS